MHNNQIHNKQSKTKPITHNQQNKSNPNLIIQTNNSKYQTQPISRKHKKNKNNPPKSTKT